MKYPKHRYLTRFTAMIIVICLLSFALISCVENNTVGGTTTQGSEENTSAVVETTTDSNIDSQGFIKDKLPESIDLGVTLTMLYWSDFYDNEFFADESDTGMVEQAIYRRNKKVSERLGIKMEYEGTPGNASHYKEYVSKIDSVFSSGNIYDFYVGYTLGMAATAQGGYCANLLGFDDIDFTAPWWPQKLVDELTINNKLFFATGDLSTTLLYMMYVMYFNKDIITDLNLENPYDCVENNSWTYDKMLTMARATEGMQNASDPKYGFTANTMHTDPFFYGAELRTIDKDADGKPVISDKFNSETTQNIVTMICSFFSEPVCEISSKCNDLMANGNSMFLMSLARSAQQYFADTKLSYGIVPIPKYKAEQETYSTCLQASCSYYSISEAAPHKNEAAMVLECMSSEGYRTVTPVLFDVVLKIRYSTDPQAAKTFDLAREGVSFDLGRLYSAMFGNLTYSLFRNCITKDNPNFSQTFKANQKKLTSYLEEMIKAFN